MGRYQDLDVYRVAMDVAVRVYRATERLPREERYGLSAQMRGAAVSIASNIAEGAARRTRGEFRLLLSSASGSAAELECQLDLCARLHYIEPAEHERLAADIRRVRQTLHRLIASLQPPGRADRRRAHRPAPSSPIPRER